MTILYTQSKVCEQLLMFYYVGSILFLSHSHTGLLYQYRYPLLKLCRFVQDFRLSSSSIIVVYHRHISSSSIIVIYHKNISLLSVIVIYHRHLKSSYFIFHRHLHLYFDIYIVPYPVAISNLPDSSSLHTNH